jgi:hypothetical protein
LCPGSEAVGRRGEGRAVLASDGTQATDTVRMIKQARHVCSLLGKKLSACSFRWNLTDTDFLPEKNIIPLPLKSNAEK